MGRKSKYSKELKISIVKRYLSGDGSTYTLADELGTTHSVIRRWVKKYEANGEEAFNISNTNSSYTKEFKEKAVLAYLNGEASYTDIAIKFNISSPETLRVWIKAYNSDIELKDYIPGGDIYMTKSRKVTPEERLEIVKYCIDHELDYKSTAKIFDVPYANVNSWTKKYIANGEEGLKDKRGRHKSDDEVDEKELLRREVNRLKHELEMAQLESRLLKKLEEVERRRYAEKADLKTNISQSKKSSKKRGKKEKK